LFVRILTHITYIPNDVKKCVHVLKTNITLVLRINVILAFRRHKVNLCVIYIEVYLEHTSAKH